MAYLDSSNVEDLVADIKDLADETYAKISDIPSASTAIPLSSLSDGSTGSSNKYAREDHVHPRYVTVYTYNQATGDFLDYVVSNIVPEMISKYGSEATGYIYIPFETNNFTGWPVSYRGYAFLYRRLNEYYIQAHTRNNEMYIARYVDNAWSGWIKTSNEVKHYLYYNITPDDFLAWVENTFTTNGSYFVGVYSTNNTVNLPGSTATSGMAIVSVSTNYIYIEYTNRDGLTYTNCKYNSWGSWIKVIKETDFVSDTNYIKLPDGTMIQWGSVSGLAFNNSNLLSGTVTLNQSFINSNYVITANPTSTGVNQYLFRLGVNPSSVSQFNWTLGTGDSASTSITGRGFSWTAIGKWK